MSAVNAKSIVLVTGSASGIGKAVVASAAQAGATVLALDIQDAADSLRQANADAAGDVHFMRCDVGSPEDWQSVANKLQELGSPSHIHLNAGIQIAPPEAPMSDYQFEAMQLARYRQMMAVNVDGVVFGLQALLPLCNTGTAIVVTSSLAGITPYAIDPLYAMSKHAVSGLVRSLGPTLNKRGIKINAICPGGIDTAIIPHEQRAAADEASRAVDMDALMTAEHVAQEVLHLMSVPETGKTWAKVAQNKPAFIVRAPGDREGKSKDKSKGKQ